MSLQKKKGSVSKFCYEIFSSILNHHWCPLSVHFASTFWNTKKVKYNGCFGFATGHMADCENGFLSSSVLGGSVFTG